MIPPKITSDISKLVIDNNNLMKSIRKRAGKSIIDITIDASELGYNRKHIRKLFASVSESPINLNPDGSDGFVHISDRRLFKLNGNILLVSSPLLKGGWCEVKLKNGSYIVKYIQDKMVTKKPINIIMTLKSNILTLCCDGDEDIISESYIVPGGDLYSGIVDDYVDVPEPIDEFESLSMSKHLDYYQSTYRKRFRMYDSTSYE